MKIIVLNGSPKGNVSVTMQYVKFIQEKFPEHELKIMNISERIKKIERNEAYFKEIISEIDSADGILWAFPLYVFLVAAQYKRFIEMITEKQVQYAFKNKYTSVLTTSIHFYDHTAHNYMNAICDDLDMKYLGYYSADMEDLFKESERKNLTTFARNFFEDIKSGVVTTKNYLPISKKEFQYKPSLSPEKIDNHNQKVVVISDLIKDDSNLNSMVKTFKNSLDNVEYFNLNDIDIKGSCLGCLQCGYNNVCVYEGKDDFIDFYNKLKGFDVIIFAGTIEDRYLSSTWKEFFDRGFFNTHIPIFKDKQLGFIISGPLNQNSNLREIMDGYSQWQEANLVDFVTDESEDSNEIDMALQNLARQVIRSASSNYVKPSTFLGVGGMKIFRDAIYGRLRFPFQADHKYYSENGLYDFPQKDMKIRVQNMILILISKIPSIRKDIYQKKLKQEMIRAFENI
ncbi:flavodoxin family protein [Methanobacterium spitsbergense]|uniref:NAD(P)H-dependent oxidoreductase n=2 Tax=Methanobacterium TaxID=2160 RepID=A0A8T5V4D7_9EURY|nr:NAD(P)H-dependent oxidoreductase [Methanobacterium spitsbergense]MBZ2166751.1 NAD(P)H-dependent oxidoreductase [Methanobacterium spitsbergense]